MTLLLDFSYGKWLFLRYSIVMRPLSCVAGLDDWKTNSMQRQRYPKSLAQMEPGLPAKTDQTSTVPNP